MISTSHYVTSSPDFIWGHPLKDNSGFALSALYMRRIYGSRSNAITIRNA